jgi:hypothetical protein
VHLDDRVAFCEGKVSHRRGKQRVPASLKFLRALFIERLPHAQDECARYDSHVLIGRVRVGRALVAARQLKTDNERAFPARIP